MIEARRVAVVTAAMATAAVVQVVVEVCSECGHGPPLAPPNTHSGEEGGEGRYP